MRLQELFLTQEDLASKRKDKLAALQKAVEDGRAPEIHDAGGTLEGWSWGDLRDLGWAEKEQEPVGNTEYEESWVYSSAAPGPITLLKKWTRYTRGNPKPESGGERIVMQPGDRADPVIVDYS